MRRLAVGTALLAAALSSPAQAQCAGGVTADACTKAVDLWAYMMPQLGTSLVGGSHTLGVGSTLGGFGHFAVALRGNAVMGDLPDLSGITVGIAGAQSSNIATNSQVVGLPGVDLALGVFKGIPLGVTRVGGAECSKTCPSAYALSLPWTGPVSPLLRTWPVLSKVSLPVLQQSGKSCR